MKVAIIGMGYVGRPLFDLFKAKGVNVVGYDTNPQRTTCDVDALPETDVFIICVPTPLTKHLSPDLRSVNDAARLVSKYARHGDLVVLESTTYPGTTREHIVPQMISGVLVAYSPERIDPGSSYPLADIPKVVGGYSTAALLKATEVYAQIFTRVHQVDSLEAAEATKILENVFRCVNIAMVNELKMIFDAMKIDIWEVIKAAKTKPYGFMPFYPGPGLGGHCIPVDPYYLSWAARGAGMPTRFIELAGEINRAMPGWVAHRVLRQLGFQGRAAGDASVLLLGLAYKPGIPDDRESPTYAVHDELQKAGVRVSICDPFFAGYQERLDQIDTYDAVVMLTAHPQFDLEYIAQKARVIIDTRGVFKPGPKVVQA